MGGRTFLPRGTRAGLLPAIASLHSDSETTVCSLTNPAAPKGSLTATERFLEALGSTKEKQNVLKPK